MMPIKRRTRWRPAETLIGEDSRYLATAKERILRKYPINLVHQINRRLIKANRRVIDRGTADLEQLTLARQAQGRCCPCGSSRGVQTGSSL